MKTAKGFIAGVLVTVMLMGGVSFAAGMQQNIPVMFNSVNIKVNGTPVSADNILYNGTTYVPLRAIATMLGKEIGWDAVSNTASINDKGTALAPTTLPQVVKTSRTSPATLGQTVSVNRDDWYYGKQNYDITLIETKSGAAAWNLISDANQFNSEPPAGKEYILAKFKIKVNDLEKSTIGINNAMFDVISGGGIKYEGFYSVSGLDPAWSTDLYEGAEFTGWAYFIVDKADSNPVVAINRSDESSTVWFKLR